ncbi:divergent AAA domain-containing protein [Roseibium sp. TrichSKD4]|uniref:AlbA family DNA-binding domain-containing protein n=1 Tax=Roseibium sp. TrichSKD4 TaxID=744980 RepID=UPI0001E57268|nr:ATP-binding protein [Roseibium sp. TrichSKD4]EFO29691.1 divergent AAA domain-containing protein [Roseibium sp. TrichSKD4]
MKRNTLSGFEVSIIKSLLETRRFQNQEIAGMINRSRGKASSDINSGRISNIKNDQIKKYEDIPPASKADVDDFIKAYQLGQFSSSSNDPLNDNVIDRILPVSACGTKLQITETSQIECKQGLNIPLKTIAAFGNNSGGYIVSGVKNSTWEIVGVKKEKVDKFDLNNLNQQIRSNLGVYIDVNYKVRSINKKLVMIFYIPPAHTKPVIMTKSSGEYSEGAIYFRYPGEDRLIGPSELSYIIEERVRSLSETVLQKHLSNILRVGIENAAILDLASGEVEGKSGKFVISKELMPELRFIKEGQFEEKGGAPTLKLIGNLESADSSKIHLVPEDVLKLYTLDNKDVVRRVKSSEPSVRQREIDNIIRSDNIKCNDKFAHPIFTSDEKAKKYRETGTLPKAVKCRYNEAAVDQIVKRLAEELD